MVDYAAITSDAAEALSDSRVSSTEKGIMWTSAAVAGTAGVVLLYVVSFPAAVAGGCFAFVGVALSEDKSLKSKMDIAGRMLCDAFPDLDLTNASGRVHRFIKHADHDVIRKILDKCIPTHKGDKVQ
eukprot:Rmarinus@m.6024